MTERTAMEIGKAIEMFTGVEMTLEEVGEGAIRIGKEERYAVTRTKEEPLYIVQIVRNKDESIEGCIVSTRSLKLTA